MGSLSPNFAFLEQHDRRLAVTATAAERLFHVDAVACLVRLRLLGELLADEAAAHAGLYDIEREDQVQLLRRLWSARLLTREVADLFHSLRKAGNRAVHDGQGDASDALHQLKRARALAVWFHRSFGGNARWKPGPFVPPRAPQEASESRQGELALLQQKLAASEAAELAARLDAEAAHRVALSAAERAREEEEENVALEALLDEAAEREAMGPRLRTMQQAAKAAPAATREAVIALAEAAGQELDLDEEETRAVLIDDQLRRAGWVVDSRNLTFAKGARPEEGKNMAIAEWPTGHDWADYILFVGLQAIATIEAKRRNTNVRSYLAQASRYSALYEPGQGSAADRLAAGGPWAQHRIPFLYSTSGRGLSVEFEEESGIWFLDGRFEGIEPVVREEWETPESLMLLIQASR